MTLIRIIKKWRTGILKLSYRSEIWYALWQHCIWLRRPSNFRAIKNSVPLSRGFQTSRDLPERSLSAWSKETQVFIDVEKADIPTFMPTKWIFRECQILSHWYHFEAQLVGNNIWKNIGILSTEILAILISIYKSKILVIRFSSHTIERTKSPPQSHLALRKYSSTKSY